MKTETAVRTTKTATRSLNLGCERPVRAPRPSARTERIATAFGLTRPGGRRRVFPAEVRLASGQIALLLGPSGAGKSTALTAIERHVPGACVVNRIIFPPEAAVIDRIAPWAALEDALAIATRCGLGDANLWLRTFDHLSEGERFRAKLARAVAFQSRDGTVTPLLCDEFGSLLHRRAARAVSFGLRKLATRYRFVAVVASSNGEILPDLRPDVIVHLNGHGRCRIERCTVPRRHTFALRRRMRIEPGSKRDYDAFAAMHYRSGDELGFVDKVFVLRESAGGEAVGIVVYAHPPIELTLRNHATNYRFSGRPDRVNRDLRILRRLVIHPDLRGCGLGHFLVRRTLPMVGTPYVECLATMGAFNPVFERAGMTRVGQYPPSAKRCAALNELRRMGIDPNRAEFVTQVCRSIDVRRIVTRVVYEWYTGTTGHGRHRVRRQSPAFLAQTFRALIGLQPVYYLWHRDANVARKLNPNGRCRANPSPIEIRPGPTNVPDAENDETKRS